jgi:hypothetical protein
MVATLRCDFLDCFNLLHLQKQKLINMEIKIMGKEINEISSASARVELKRLIVGLAITLIGVLLTSPRN